MDNIEAIFAEATGGNDTVPDDWMAATGMRPLLQNDPGLLWLKLHGEEEGFERDSAEYAFLPFIARKGQEFEAMWLQKEAPGTIQAMKEDWNVRQSDTLLHTLQLIKSKTPTISKAALWWKPEKIYGSSDLICLTSWLYKKFPHLRPEGEKAQPDHYVVLDMKYTSGLHTYRRREDLENYACQLRIYSYALGHLQGYMPTRAYIVSRDRIHDPIAIEVNQELGKPLDKELRDFREQFRRIKLRGKRLKPWKDEEVAPNFSNNEDEPWHQAKKKIQTEMVKGQSLTLLPGIGNKLADALEDAGYDCLADLLAKKPEDIPLEEIGGIGSVMAARIRAVLKANRSKKAAKIPILLVPRQVDIELFIDMEFFSNINVDLEKQWPTLAGCAMCFMIGVGWQERGKWKYTQFVAEAESHKAERKMWKEFTAFLEEKGVFDEKRTAALYHWSAAEPRQVKLAIERHGGALKKLGDLPWLDLLQEVFHAGHLALPGAWNYGLKEVSSALGDYSEAHKISWPEGLSSGNAAQVAGWEAYRQDKPLDTLEMAVLKKYLEADVKATWCILRWLRDSTKEERKRLAVAAGGSWYTMLVGEETHKVEPLRSNSVAGWYEYALRNSV